MNHRTFGLRWMLVPLGAAIAAGVIVFSGGLTSAQTPSPSPSASPSPDTTQTSPTGQTQSYDDILADELGIDVNELREAQSTARDRYFDQLADSGKLTEEQAADLKASSPGQIVSEALGNSDLNLVRGFIETQVASVLNIDVNQLQQDLKDGKTFSEIAEENGNSDQEVRDELQSRLDQLIDFAADAGFVDEEDATDLKANVSDILDAIMEMGGGSTGGSDTEATPSPTP